MSTGHTITDLDMRYPYTVASISAATTMGINNTYLGVVGTGTNVIAIVYNSSSSAKTLTLPSSVSGYSARRNTSSISIPAYGFGEVAVLKAGTTLYKSNCINLIKERDLIFSSLFLFSYN